MSQSPYDLPPLTALASFEAAARHESFKAAAQELNVTPAAVSHQVKALEETLDLPLALGAVAAPLSRPARKYSPGGARGRHLVTPCHSLGVSG